MLNEASQNEKSLVNVQVERDRDGLVDISPKNGVHTNLLRKMQGSTLMTSLFNKNWALQTPFFHFRSQNGQTFNFIPYFTSRLTILPKVFCSTMETFKQGNSTWFIAFMGCQVFSARLIVSRPFCGQSKKFFNLQNPKKNVCKFLANEMLGKHWKLFF